MEFAINVSIKGPVSLTRQAKLTTKQTTCPILAGLISFTSIKISTDNNSCTCNVMNA